MPIQMICLANSVKHRNHCIAGRLMDRGLIGPWIRPTGNRMDESLLLEEIRLPDRTLPSLLDILEVSLGPRRPTLHQIENFQLDVTRKWERAGKLPQSADSLKGLLSRDADLWLPGSTSRRGLLDCVPRAELDDVSDSLRFIQPTQATIQIMKLDGRWHPRAHFWYLGREYNLKVTDPLYGTTRFGEKPQQISLRNSYLTISLGELFDGYAYKLVAGVLEVSDE